MVQEAAPMKALPSANARPARKGMISVCFKGHMYMSAPPEFISKKKTGVYTFELWLGLRCFCILAADSPSPVFRGRSGQG